MTLNIKLTHRPRKLFPLSFQTCIAQAAGLCNVLDKCEQAELLFQNPICALGDESLMHSNDGEWRSPQHMNEQQTNPLLQNIMINSVILTASWMQRCWGAIPDELRFGKTLLHLWDLLPWLRLLLQRRFLQLTVYFLQERKKKGVGGEGVH